MNSDLNEKSGLLKFFSYAKKMINENTYYQKEIEKDNQKNQNNTIKMIKKDWKNKQ